MSGRSGPIVLKDSESNFLGGRSTLPGLVIVKYSAIAEVVFRRSAYFGLDI